MRESPREAPASGLSRQASSTTMLSPLRAAAIWSTTSAVATASRLNSSPLPRVEELKPTAAPPQPVEEEVEVV